MCACRREWNPTCVAASGHCELGRFWDVAFGTELGRILGKKEGGGLPKKFKNPNKNGLFEDYKSVNFRRCFLRPILGGLAAGLLFITIISGGAIIWEGTESVRGYSVGIIAVFASLKCEQLPRLLQRLAARSMPPNSQ